MFLFILTAGVSTCVCVSFNEINKPGWTHCDELFYATLVVTGRRVCACALVAETADDMALFFVIVEVKLRLRLRLQHISGGAISTASSDSSAQQQLVCQAKKKPLGVQSPA